MMVSMEAYFRRGQRVLQRMMLDPKVRSVGTVLACAGSGFLFSAASLMHAPQPLAMGLICSTTGWRALVICLGAMVGYPAFWGSAGNQGIVWSAAGGLLALLLGKREESKDQPLMIPAIAAFLTAVTGLTFRMILKEETPVEIFVLRMAMALLACMLFTQAGGCRDTITDWLVGGVAVPWPRSQWVLIWGWGTLLRGPWRSTGLSRQRHWQGWDWTWPRSPRSP